MQAAAPLTAEAERTSAFDSIGKLGRAVDAMRERTELLEAVVDNFPGGIALYDHAMRMVLCNERLTEMLALPPSLFASGQPTMEELFRFNAARGEYGPGDPEAQVARRMALLHERCAHVYERTRPNGLVIEVRGVPLATGGFVTTYFDVTEQRRAQATIAHMAHHDYLTDLPNRALFTSRAETAIAAAEENSHVAVHCLDLDGFKRVNDTLGHHAGDDLLKLIADRLRACVGENDTVARLGGDEFAIIQTDVTHSRYAGSLAARIVDALRISLPSAQADLPVGASIGIAVAPTDGTTMDEILRKADAALYRSKAAGRGRYTFYSA